MSPAFALLLVPFNPVPAGPHPDPGPADRYAVPYAPVTYGHAVTAPLPAFARDFALTDWDGDGRVDLLAKAPRGGGVVWYRNVGSAAAPLFRPLRENVRILEPTAPLGRFFAVADFDGNGRTDLAGFDSQGSAKQFGKAPVRLRIYRNAGGPPERPRWETIAAGHPDGSPVLSPADVKDAPTLAAGDLDGDGRPDLVLGLQELNAVYPDPGKSVGQNRTAGFRTPSDYRPTAARVAWLRNVAPPGGPPAFAPAEFLRSGGATVAAYNHPYPELADLNADGRTDLLLGSHRPGVRAFLNVGGPPGEAPALAEMGPLADDRGRAVFSAGLVRVRAGDLDGDGTPELVGTGYFGEANRYRTLHRLPGGGYEPRWGEGVPLSIRTTPGTPLYGYGNSTVDPVDWDGDGDLDLLLGAEPGTPGVAINVGDDADRRFLPPVRLKWADGTDLETYPIQTGDGSHWGPGEWYTDRWSPRAVDWDGDGVLDLVTGSMGRRLYLARGVRVDGDLRFAGVENFTRGGTELAVPDRLFPALPDWNGDGRPDALIPDFDGRLLVHPGDGTVGLGEPIELRGDGFDLRVADYWGRVKGNRTGVAVADWDGDGARDLVVNRFHAGVFLHRGRPGRRDLFGPAEPLVAPLYTHLAGPAVLDWDGDGVLDLLIGGDERRMLEPPVRAHLAVFRGRDTLTPPGDAGG